MLPNITSKYQAFVDKIFDAFRAIPIRSCHVEKHPSGTDADELAPRGCPLTTLVCCNAIASAKNTSIEQALGFCHPISSDLVLPVVPDVCSMLIRRGL